MKSCELFKGIEQPLIAQSDHFNRENDETLDLGNMGGDQNRLRGWGVPN